MGWECRRCTFQHHAPGTRCVMCHELRVNKEHMRDFILGKNPTLNDAYTHDNYHDNNTKNESSSSSVNATATAGTSLSQQQQQLRGSGIETFARVPFHNSTGVVATRNPYATNHRPSSSQTWPFERSSARTTLPQQQQQQPQQLSNTSMVRLSTTNTAGGAVATARNQQHPAPVRLLSQSKLHKNVAGSSTGLTIHNNNNRVLQPWNQATTSTSLNQQHPADVAAPTPSLSEFPAADTGGQAPIVFVPPQPMFSNQTSRTTTTTTSTHLTVPASRSTATEGNRKRPRSLAPLAALPYQPGRVPLAMEHAGTWIYPSVDAYPKRQYQFEIAKSAILQNTLVSLPTGLGKTLIAAVVLYNYYRWFPTGKILFLAPTLPLVDQQVQACYEIMGIPATDTALLTGKIPATQRAVVWNEKRVFFCTPQTVQKDLENNRCDASKVVCVVLDEAHKSTGDYAYCKVIAHLEKAGAKFRILGLSATPGTSIKAIQLVVDILRINCIEARSDADPDVKQYIHDRQTEVVVVKQITAVTKPVERRLDGMIAPILEALRQRHALPSRLIGNATVTSYCLLTARESYNKRPEHQRDHITLGYFAAGMRLIQIRSDLHQLGIGSVRNKLHQLRQERPRGYLATLVKSPDFQLLWAAVDQISCDPSDFGNNTVQDKLKNNPKLEKLREILTEHFERARACGTLSSTRAIVFSQFRTSVSEIVSVLNEYQPLIRARHFVGQAKSQRKQQQEPSSGSSEGLLLQPQAKATTTTTSVEGMRQDEQKAVIAEFRNGIHNALVCTSIGEEGLDIGDVDLIVNFDCLSSPIRTIQRVGRTGRKRNGRVVTLVAEGQEEKTLAKSRQNERNLVHALKNPKSFIVVPNAPMFPNEPVVCESNMTISQNFHMSQVHGARKKMKKRLSGGSGLRQSLGGGGGSRRWKLTDSENQQRSYMLGDPLKDLCINQDATNDNNAPLSISALIRRRLLVGRAMSRSRNVSNENRHFGRTCQLLRKIEASHSLAGDLSDLPSKAGRARKFSEAVIDVLFPLTLFDDCTMNHADSAVANYHSTFELASTGFLTSVLAPAEDNSKPSETASMQESRLILGDGATVTQLHTSRPKADPLTNPFGEALSFDSSNASRATGATNGNAPVPPVLLRKNPYSTHRNESDSSLRTGLSHASTPLFASTTRTGRSSQQGLLPQDEQISTFVTCTSLQVVDEELQCYTSATATNTLDVANSGEVVQHGGDLLEVDEFRLPSQQDSSSDSGDGEDDCYVACAGVAMIPADVSHIEDDLFRLPTQSSEDENDGNDVVDALPAKPKEDARDDAFRLPTPEPSSDEEASETEELRGIDRKLNRDDVTPLSDYAAVNSVTVTEPIACTTTLRAAVQEGLAHDSSQGSVLQCTQRAAAHVRFSLDNSPEPEALLTRKNRKKRFLVIEDSPESKTEPSSTVYYAFTGGLGHVLSNTQEGDLDKDMELSYENLVCAVCQKNDLSDDDPIILCDGPGGCVRCDLSVHVSCYSAAVDLDDDAAEWRCDRCKFLHGGGEGHAIVCYLCLRPDGAIKRLTGNKWKHAICKTTSECTGLKRLRRQQVNLVLKSKPTGPARRPLLDLPSNADGSLEAAARRMKRRRQLIMRQFIDDEADASEDDITGDHEEEDDVLVIEEEEEEFAKSFINDSSQLGCTQDELDARADVATHRALDVERERMRQFATPVLNQRTREAVYSEGSDTPASGSDSMRGLGKMHFIRSVLEHHRQGGRAEDIETFYQQLEGKEVDTHDETDW